MNQTAKEIAKEYETMAIDAANQHFRLRQRHPFTEFPMLARHVQFCTVMNLCWESIAKKLDTGPEIYPGEDDWGMCHE